MKRLANISIAFTTLILLVLGSGGISVERCACSGKTQFLTLSDFNCCPTEGTCMTVTSAHLSDSSLPDQVDMPQLSPVIIHTAEWQPLLCSIIHTDSDLLSSAGYPPPRFSLTTVLRV